MCLGMLSQTWEIKLFGRLLRIHNLKERRAIRGADKHLKLGPSTLSRCNELARYLRRLDGRLHIGQVD